MDSFFCWYFLSQLFRLHLLLTSVAMNNSPSLLNHLVWHGYYSIFTLFLCYFYFCKISLTDCEAYRQADWHKEFEWIWSFGERAIWFISHTLSSAWLKDLQESLNKQESWEEASFQAIAFMSTGWAGRGQRINDDDHYKEGRAVSKKWSGLTVQDSPPVIDLSIRVHRDPSAGYKRNPGTESQFETTTKFGWQK